MDNGAHDTDPRSPDGKAPRVSVVVPVYNRRAMLAELLDGLDKQTYGDFEVIVVDDGSTDGSGQMASARVVRGRPVRVVAGRHEGAVEARRQGVAASEAEILAFTDSDCVPTPAWLEYLVAAIDTGAQMAHGRTGPIRPLRPLERSMGSNDEGLYPTCNAAYRRRAYDAAGGFDLGAADTLGYRHDSRARGLGFGEDTLLGVHVREQGTVAFEPRALVHHQVFPPDVIDTLSRAWQTGAFPSLIRAVPALRETILRDGIHLGRRTRVPVYALAGAVVFRRRLLAGLAMGWWVTSRLAELRQTPAAWPERLRALPVEMAVDVVTAAALITGSVRTGEVVL